MNAEVLVLFTYQSSINLGEEKG